VTVWSNLQYSMAVLLTHAVRFTTRVAPSSQGEIDNMRSFKSFNKPIKQSAACHVFSKRNHKYVAQVW